MYYDFTVITPDKKYAIPRRSIIGKLSDADSSLMYPNEYYQDYFEFSYNKNGRLLCAKEKADVIQTELELCGYFCIITSENMTAEQALIKYKGRNAEN